MEGALLLHGGEGGGGEGDGGEASPAPPTSSAWPGQQALPGCGRQQFPPSFHPLHGWVLTPTNALVATSSCLTFTFEGFW